MGAKSKQGELFPAPVTPRMHPGGAGHLPEWLTRLVTQKQPAGARNARWTECRNCRQIILTGWDDDLLAEHAEVDPTPLNPQQELAARLTGRKTYTLETRQPETPQIWQRSIRAEKPAGQTHWPVVPQHRCGRRFPGFVIPPVHPVTPEDKPPF